MGNVIHIPVLKKEVLFYLNCHPGGIYVDGTVGGGGHAEAILEASRPNGFLIGIDWDNEAITYAEKMLNPYSGRYALVRGNFTEMGAILTALGRKKVNGILLDLGMSFLQLADSQRGFSFLHNGPLDMRMDRRRGLMADQIINRWPQKQLKEVIKEYGEEKWAGRLARKIVETRIKTPITTTAQLCEIITKTISRRYWGSHLHPATRTFQALRLAVNDELKNLKQFLEGALDLLTSKGRLVIICFHSLEDRLVKVSFRKWAKEGKVQLLTKKPIGPLKEEIAINPKARSAKLRSIERI